MGREPSNTLTPVCNTLVERVYQAIVTTPIWAHVAERVAWTLQPFLGAPGLLTPEQSRPDPAGYRQHVLYVAPDERFSIAALVSLPGQTTPVHDHVAWCVAGVHQGEEYEIAYRRLAIEKRQWLLPIDGRRKPAGTITELVPPDDLHQSANRGTGIAISIQICGANTRRVVGGMRQRYDLPLLPSMEDLADLHLGKNGT